MKNKRGFTLIELMAVVVIISLIAILTFPNIINQVNKSKDANKSNINSVVIEAAKKYVSDNKDEYDKDTFAISIQELIDNGYVNEDIVNTYDENISDEQIVYMDNKYSVKDKQFKLYKELEYIESTGTQYIDTLYIPKINTKLELDVKFSGNFKSNGLSIFSSSNYNTSVFQLNFGATGGLYSWINKPYENGGTIENFSITDDIRQNRNTITMQSGFISYGTVSRTLSIKTTDNDISLILFGARKQDNSMNVFAAYNMYVYGLKLYESDTLKRNFIPVLDYNNVPCLYDKVEGKFYYNKGTGEFLYNE